MNIRKKISKVSAVVGLALLNAEAGLFITIGTVADLTQVSEVGWRILIYNKKLYSLMCQAYSPALNKKEWEKNKEIQMRALRLINPRCSSTRNFSGFRVVK